MKDLSVQEEVEPRVHERLADMGFVKEYSDDRSCFWYTIAKTNLPFFQEIEITYDVENGYLYLYINLSDSSDVNQLLLNTFDLELVEMFLVDSKFIYHD